MCPNSPATQVSPLKISPLRTTPPPIPVPIVTQTKLSCPFPAPSHFSPRAAQFTSFSKTAGMLNLFSSFSTRFVPIQPGIIGFPPITLPILPSI